jgi:predicted metallopeptidase
MKLVIDKKLQQQIKEIVVRSQLSHIDPRRIICFRSFEAKSRAYARIWALPRIWQIALNLKAHYCLEVLSEHFSRLSASEQVKVLIHELLHIPKNFSGALLPHRRRRKWGINQRHIEKIFKRYQQTCF